MPTELKCLDTVIITRPGEFMARLGRETLLVTGSSRGGTSLLAYALRCAGYPLIASPDALNHEHFGIMESRNDKDALKRIITDQNAAPRWGFKLPAASKSIDWYVRELRNPIIAVIYRNPLAIARSILLRQDGWDQSPHGLSVALRHGLNYMLAATDALDKVPTILIDMELAQRKSETFMRELCEALELDLANDALATIANKIAVPGYKNFDPTTVKADGG